MSARWVDITVSFQLPDGYEGDWRDDPIFDQVAEPLTDPHPVFGDLHIVGGLREEQAPSGVVDAVARPRYERYEASGATDGLVMAAEQRAPERCTVFLCWWGSFPHSHHGGIVMPHHGPTPPSGSSEPPSNLNAESPGSSALESSPDRERGALPTSWTAIRAVVRDYGWLTIVGPDPEGIWHGEGTWHEAEHIQSWEPLLTRTEWARRSETTPDEVLIEGSFFAVADLPKILGNFMRAADENAREAKRLLQGRDELQEMLTTPLPAQPTPDGERPDLVSAIEAITPMYADEWPITGVWLHRDSVLDVVRAHRAADSRVVREVAALAERGVGTDLNPTHHPDVNSGWWCDYLRGLDQQWRDRLRRILAVDGTEMGGASVPSSPGAAQSSPQRAAERGDQDDADQHPDERHAPARSKTSSAATHTTAGSVARRNPVRLSSSRRRRSMPARVPLLRRTAPRRRGRGHEAPRTVAAVSGLARPTRLAPGWSDRLRLDRLRMHALRTENGPMSAQVAARRLSGVEDVWLVTSDAGTSELGSELAGVFDSLEAAVATLEYHHTGVRFAVGEPHPRSGRPTTGDPDDQGFYDWVTPIVGVRHFPQPGDEHLTYAARCVPITTRRPRL